MKVLILGGFLGSGKTSLLMDLAHFMTDTSKASSPVKVVILENEVGKNGIDDKLLKSQGYQVQNLFAGCVCCTLGGELIPVLQQLEKEYAPDWLILETTGLAYPGLIQENLMGALKLSSRICTVTDASRWKRLRKPMEGLLKGQVQTADTVLINKMDLASEEDLKAMEADILEMNPKAVIYRTSALEPVDPFVWESVLGVNLQ